MFGVSTLELILKIYQHTIVMRVMWCNLSNGIQWCFYVEIGIENNIKVYKKCDKVCQGYLKLNFISV